jgi:nanoRNase/pAp phosphatase (c-di-AMP/oligoRNAs hydrolase)
MDKTKLAEIVSSLKSASRILVTTHIRPDADAIGGLLGFNSWLKSQNSAAEVKLAVTGSKDPSWDFLKGIEQVNWVKDVAFEVEDFELVVFLDGNTWDRFSYQELDAEWTEKLAAKTTICLDHHPEPAQSQFKLQLIDTNRTAVAELIAQYFFIDQGLQFDKQTAEYLLLGIIGDTGQFAYVSPERAEVFNVTAKLVAEGKLDVQTLLLKTQTMPGSIIPLMEELLKNSTNVDLEVGGQPASFSYSYLGSKFLDKYDRDHLRLAKDVYQGVFLRKIEGYGWGFVVTPVTEDEFSVSLRSVPGQVNVRLIAEQRDGGGHNLAAGIKRVLTKSEQGSIDSRQVAEEIVALIKSSELQLT